MEGKEFITLIRPDHRLSKNEYVTGRIFGIAEIMCGLCERLERVDDGNGKSYFRETWRGIFWSNTDGTVQYLQMYCTEEQYEKFEKYVETQYPDLCMFNYGSLLE